MNGNNVERLYNEPILQTDVVKLYSKDIIKYNWNDGQGQKYTNTHTKIVVDKGIYKKKKYIIVWVWMRAKDCPPSLSMKYFLSS